MVKELLKQTEKELKLEITAGAISSFRSKELTRSGARILNAGKITSASFVGEMEESRLFERCAEQEDAAVPFDYNIPGNSKYSKSLVEADGRGIENLHELTDSALNRLKKANSRFIYSGKAACTRIHESLKNSNGVDHSIEYEGTEWVTLYKHKKSANIIDGWFGCRTIGKADFTQSIDRNLPFLDAFENQATISTGMKNIVVFDPEDWLLTKLSESLRIDKYRDNSALFSGRMGEKLFSDKFSLYDVNYAPEYAVTAPFDGEGTLREEHYLPLIEKGVITNLICDLRYGKKYGASSTGNGHRAFDSGVKLNFNPLAVGRGEKSFDSLISEFEECIFVALATGGDFTDTGDFSSPVALSFLFRNGKIVGRLPQITLKSSIQKMFGPQLLAVSGDGFLKSRLNPCMFMEMQVLLN